MYRSIRLFSILLAVVSLCTVAQTLAQLPNFEWARRMGSTNYDNAEDMVLDASGNVYTTGYFNGTADFNPGAGTFNLISPGGRDVFISKLDANGNFVWAKQIGGTGEDSGLAITLDNLGNIYIAGYFQGTADFDPGAGTFNMTGTGTLDMFIVKLDPNGNFVWAKQPGTTGVGETPFSLFIDGAGNILISGFFNGTIDFDPGAGVSNLVSGYYDAFILKLNTNGELIWVRQLGAAEVDEARAVTADNAGNVYFTGYFRTTVDFDPGPSVFNMTSTGDEHIYVCKLDVNGNFVWAVGMGGAEFDVGQSIVIDGSSVYTTGYFRGTVDFDPGAGVLNKTSAGDTDIYVHKLDVNGNFVWVKTMGNTLRDDGNDVAIDASGNVYTAGFFYGTVDFDPNAGVFNQTSAGGQDIFITKFSADGDFKWARRMGGTDWDQAFRLNVDANDNIYAAGYFRNTVDFDPGTCTSNLSANALNEIFVLKFRQQSSGADPTVTSFTPAYGNVGTPITINGTNFSTVPANNAVRFNGIAATVTASTTTVISTTVPASATTGKITVGVGCITNESLNNFTLGPAPIPTVTSFAPQSGPVGTSVTITGTNFETIASSNVVYFGATKAIVTAATATQLTVTVPIGATYQPISILVNGLTAFSDKPFSVTFAGGGVIGVCSLSPFTGLTPGFNPYNVALGDLDGDGKSDLVTADYSSNTISIFRNLSTPGTIAASSFASVISFTTGTNPLGVVIQDLDGDAKPEIIVANNNSNTISIFRNTSVAGTINASSFASKVDFATGNRPHDVTVNDFDADGKPDIAVSNTSGSSVSVFKNTSTLGAITTGSFAAKVDFTTGFGPQGIASRDLDGDGKVDIVVANESNTSASVLRNTSSAGVINTGSFAAKVDFTTGPNPTDVAIADLDGDGKQDFAVSNADDGSLSVFRNTATAGIIDASSFSAKVGFSANGGYNITIDDIDGDNKPDLLTNSDPDKFAVLKNQSTPGAFNASSFSAPQEFATASDIDGIAIGDVDGDGKPDVVASGGTSDVSVLRNTTFATPTVTSFTPTSGIAGTTVVITGTNFSNTPTDNIVKFNGTDAAVTSVTSTTLTTVVPFTATTGTIAVTLGCNTATTASNFTVNVVPTNQNWVKIAEGAGSQGGEGIAIDGAGSSYTAGSFSGTTDFDPGSGVYNLIAQSLDGFVVKLDALGNFVWAKRIGGSGNDVAHAIQVDASGNIYVAGTFSGTADFDPSAATFNLTASGSREIFIMKLDSNGLFSWAKKIGGTGIDEISAIALDATANIYATGYFYGTSDFDPGTPVVNLTSAGGADAFILKLNNNGDYVWVRQIGSTELDASTAIAVSSTGNLHITGYFEGTADFDPGVGTTSLSPVGDNDVFILKLSANGDFVWVRSIGSNSYEYGYAITTDVAENVYTSGLYRNITDFDPGAGVFDLDPGSADEDAFLVKLDASGNFVWASKFGGEFGSNNPFSIGIDNAANTYITGETFDGDDGSKIMMAGFDSNGNRIFQDIASAFGSGRSIAVSSTGNLYVTGDFEGVVDFNLGDCLGTQTSSSDDVFILKTRANSFATPTITSFSPATGTAGTTVVITGTNFSTTLSNNIIDFNGEPATVTASTATSITTTVPAGSATGKISVSTGCGSTLSTADFTVSGPSLSVTQPADVSICDGQSATFATSATGTTNITYQWQFSATSAGTFNDIANGSNYSNVTTSTLSVNTTGNFGEGFYRCKIDGDFAATVFTNEASLTIQALPSAPTATSASRCGDGVLTLSASGGTDGDYKWYTVSTAGTAITGEVNSTYTTPSLSSTTQFYVANFDGTCESDRTQATATITPLSSSPTVTGANACPQSSLTLNASGGSNGQYKWYTDAIAVTPISGEVNSNYVTPALTQTTTYFVTVTTNGCESLRTPAVATIITSGCAPEIQNTPLSTIVEGTIVIDLKPLITTSGTLDVSSIKVTTGPGSGATTSIDNGVLTITYSGVNFGGTESITIEACNTNGLCGQQDFVIEVNGDIVVYNGISPNGDEKNELFILEYIDALPNTKVNTVSIYNRWGDEVFSVSNYDNKTNVFSGKNKQGNKVPPGTYYYKIYFPKTDKTVTGFLSVKY